MAILLCLPSVPVNLPCHLLGCEDLGVDALFAYGKGRRLALKYVRISGI
jgi:hypothetical protein